MVLHNEKDIFLHTWVGSQNLKTKQEKLKGLESENNREREKVWELEFLYGTQEKRQIKNPQKTRQA